MSDVAALVSRFPGEIEADLALHGIDIGDWHRGTLSDRALENILRHLPETSAFKTAARDGDWTLDQYLVAGVLNEIRAMRADLQAIFTQNKPALDLVRSPRQERAHMENTSAAMKAHDAVIAALTR